MKRRKIPGLLRKAKEAAHLLQHQHQAAKQKRVEVLCFLMMRTIELLGLFAQP